ncbi:MAG: hypothetical protein COB24_00350 [Hyphomicrobiales bacterium]|nr:MAG: hypothetical protein COB24_00350 [Hyphomicrobiales bacterium]
MAEKPFIDVSTIAGGGFVGYASIIGDIETGLGLLLVVFTLILTVMRILIAINEWRSRRK